VLPALKFRERNLRNENRTVTNVGFGSHPAELAGAKNVSRIRKGRCDTDRAGLRVQLPIDKRDTTLMWIDIPVGERQCQRKVRSTVKQIAPASADPLRKCKIFAVTYREVNLDRIEL
jgi:hypothetical protein